MRAVVQRVTSGRVTVEGEETGAIGLGLLVLLGVAAGDTEEDARWLAEKLVALRVFEDDSGRMNRSVTEVGGGLLVVSQFTLLGSTRKGNRPSFNGAADPATAEGLYDHFCQLAGNLRGGPVATGKFRAHMQVESTNDGPVTLVIDSRLRE